MKYTLRGCARGCKPRVGSPVFRFRHSSLTLRLSFVRFGKLALDELEVVKQRLHVRVQFRFDVAGQIADVAVAERY